MRNVIVAERFNLQGNIAFYIGNGDDNCIIYKVADEVVAAGATVEPLVFENQISDPNGNYRVPPEAGANPNYTYQSPANGLYTFRLIMRWTVVLPGVNRVVTVDFKRYDAGGGLVQTFSTSVTVSSLQSIYTLITNQSLYMDATDYLAVAVTFTSPFGGDAMIIRGLSPVDGQNEQATIFECTASQTGAGVVQEKEPGDYFIGEYEFETCVSREDWASIREDIAKSINFAGRVSKNGWANSIEHNYATGKTIFNLISNE